MSDPSVSVEPERFPENVVKAVRERVGPIAEGPAPVEVDTSRENTNVIARIRFADGRTLMIKRARHAWAAARFEASRRAAAELRQRVDLVTPIHLHLPDTVDPMPLQVYWHVPLPTLDELWPDIPDAVRPAVLRDWGALIRRMHRITFPGCGPLGDAEDGGPLRAYLERDLTERLRPSLAKVWPEGLDALDLLIRVVPDVAARADGGPYCLVHNDMHMGNVFCEVDGDGTRCVGLLDLESSIAGPAEADLASTLVLHGPMFGHEIEGRWFDHLLEGYGRTPDPLLLAFFRTYHLVNMGYFSRLIGRDAHADAVVGLARDAARELGAVSYAGA